MGKEAILHGHIFGRFFLPKNFSMEKRLLMLGVGMDELDD